MLARKAEPRPGPFTWDEYMDWEAQQEEKWELVDGYAVRRSERWRFDSATGMAGATRAHNRISSNLIVHLGGRLRGGPCWAAPSDLKARSPTGSGRYPDVTVECGDGTLESLLSVEPRVMLEVLSPSNTLKQQLKLLDDYQAIASVQQIVYFEQDRPSLLSWRRAGAEWPRQTLEELEAVLDLPSIGVGLPLSEIYEGLGFA